MHTHILYMAPSEVGLPPSAALTRGVLRATQNVQRCVLRGVTTVRDLAATGQEIHDIVRAIDEGWLAGPRVVSAGVGIATSGGHASGRMAVEVDGADAFRGATRNQMKHGADWIKLMLTGGVGDLRESLHECQASVEEIAAAIEEAHRKGKKITAHISNSQTAIDAVRLGIDGIEHGHYLDQHAVEAMAENGVYLTPTLEVYHRIAAKPHLEAHMVDRSNAVLEAHAESMLRAYRGGVRILAGTDSGQEFWTLGDLAYEIRRLEMAGLPNHDALMAATGRAADCLGMSGEIGSIVPGAVADLLIVEGDAAESTEALATPFAVYQNGRRLVTRDGIVSVA